MKKVVEISLLLAIFIFEITAQTQIVGLWNTENKKGVIEIYQKGDKFNGRIAEGENSQKLDIHNPDKSKRWKTLIGLEIITGFIYDKNRSKWINGKIYDPERGKTYSCKCSISPDNKTLYLRGFLGVSLLGRTTTWTRKK